MNIRELQFEAKALEKSDPYRSCELYQQAFELDKNNRYTISGLGRSLRATNRSKGFIDLCDVHDDKTIFTDNFISSSYCWCLYDAYIRPYNVENDFISKDEFLEKADFIIKNNKQLSGDECYKTPFVITVFKVVKVLDKAEENSFDAQLEWLDYIDPEILPTKKRLISNNNGENEEYDSFKEQYYSLKTWILYKHIIRLYNEIESKEGFDEFITAAEYIATHCEQQNAGNSKNPYVWTVLKVIKIYNRRDNKNYRKILEWVTKLNPDILSEEVFIITDESGKEREQASPKEYYYQYISKAYEKLQKHKECVDVCDLGLSQIKLWHYRNHIWVRARREYCNCYISEDFEQDVKAYRQIAEKEKHWFMYHKVAMLYFGRGQLDDGLLFAAKAINSQSRIDEDKMINLMFDLGIILQAKSNYTAANLFFQACGYYRSRNEWTIFEELKYVIADQGLDITVQPNLRNLQNITKAFLEKQEDPNCRIGRIEKILQHGDGFINSKGEKFYFRAREGKGLNLSQLVTFKLGVDNQNRPTAQNIRIKGE